MAPEQEIRYSRARFSTRLPVGRLYTHSHFWIAEQGPSLWRVGFTRFATRMLGEFVELAFETRPGDPIHLGQTIGWAEGFKAVSDLFCVIDGRFVRGNPRLEQEVALAETDPYGEGWLYEAEGAPEGDSVDVHGYAGFLDSTIEKMLGQGLGGIAGE